MRSEASPDATILRAARLHVADLLLRPQQLLVVGDVDDRGKSSPVRAAGASRGAWPLGTRPVALSQPPPGAARRNFPGGVAVQAQPLACSTGLGAS
eukprot:1441542-Alexandrium_andersonii.AAC.1